MFAREGRRDSLRACAVLEVGLRHARALAEAEAEAGAKGAEQPDSVEGVALALKRCEQLRKEEAGEGGSPGAGHVGVQVQVQADGSQSQAAG